MAPKTPKPKPVARLPKPKLRIVATDQATFDLVNQLSNQAQRDLTLDPALGDRVIVGPRCYRVYPELHTYAATLVKSLLKETC